MRGRQLTRLLSVAALVFATAGLSACLPAPPPGRLIVVRRPPSPPYEVVEVAPAPGYVWVAGYWSWVGADWVWVRGRWAPAPYGYRRWDRGKWKHVRGGWYWEEGRWRER